MYTAHWLAIEGVQPAIPQNPTTAESRNHELMPKGPGANPTLAAIGGSNDNNITIKPLVKHVLSKELQLYFGKVCSALMDEGNDEYRVAALASIRSDPGLHQLVPYFVQYIAEKITHNMKNLFVLTQAIHLTSAMLDNESLYVDPYVRIPPLSLSPSPLPTNPLLKKKTLDRIPHPLNSHMPNRAPHRHQPPIALPPPRSLRLFTQLHLQKILQNFPHPPLPPRTHLSQTHARPYQTLCSELRRDHWSTSYGWGGRCQGVNFTEFKRVCRGNFGGCAVT